ncbi:MAG: hypothetical protein AB7L90_21240 [Hyphomicrobiaceae bacterium]
MRLLTAFAIAMANLAGSVAVMAAEGERSGLVWLSGDDIRAAFAGRPLAGLYPSQRPWTETIGADGTTDYRESSNHWRGRWWIRNREFCFSYPPPGVGGCFRVTRISENCFELYEFGTALGGEETPPNIANLWNGRMWHADQPTTCEARPSV